MKKQAGAKGLKNAKEGKAAPHPTGTIEQKVILPAAPGVVYQALIDPELHAAFTGAAAAGKARVGGTFTAHGEYIRATYRVLKKGKRIVQDWSTTTWPEGLPPSTLDITLTAVPKGTQLHMLHTGVPADDIWRYGPGWKEHYWAPLKHFLARREMTLRKRRH